MSTMSISAMPATPAKSAMSLTRVLLAFCCVLTLLTGCNQQAIFDKLVPKEEVEVAKDIVAQLAAREIDGVEKQLDPAMLGPQTRSQLEAMAATIPAAEPKTVTTIGAHTAINGETKRYFLTFEYEYPSSWMMANVALQRTGNQLIILGASVIPLKESLRDSNRFTLEGKGMLHWVMLVAAVFVPLLTLYAVVRAIMSPIPRRKWLWVLFAAVGFVDFTLNWTTGQFNVQALSFRLLGSGFARGSEYAPWILSVSIPFGALIFLACRRSLVEQVIEEERAPAEDAA